ncbi:hypothetical protein A4A49_26092 [Nicotiana attenuata]|uniref:Uncharacterized protein n=1 Tax=Nicotiana attenuata TaxID=49451 RepID=A0A314KNA0_NICAT|nr:hypothetical protein A4A49_26092 [Nicotiana attenuata]
MNLYSSTVVNYHLNVIQNLMMEIMDNNSRMLRLLDNIENKLSTSSKTIPEAPEHTDAAVSLDDKGESDEYSAVVTDSDLDKGSSSPAENFEVLTEMVETENSEEENSKGYDYRLFAEIPDKKIDIKVGDSLKTDLVKNETQVFDEMFQIVFLVKCYYRHLVMFDNLLAKACMLSACGQDQLIGRATKNDRSCGSLSSLDHAKFMTLTMLNTCIETLELQFKSTNRVCKYVLLALSSVSLVRHMWMGRSNAPLEEIDLECAYTLELEKARRWKVLELVRVGGEDYGLGMIFYRPMVIDVANSELLMLMRKPATIAKTMHMTECTNNANYTNRVSMRSLGKIVVEKMFADNFDPYSPSDLYNIANDIFRTESSCGSYIPRTITGRVKMALSGEKVFLKHYGSGGLQEGNNIFLSCAVSDLFGIGAAWLIFNKMSGKSQ